MRSLRARFVVVLLGLLVGFVGLFGWSLESEYGSGTNFVVRLGHDGREATASVYDEGDGRSLVFEGTHAEAQAYMDRREEEGRSYVVPAVIIGIGVVLIVVGLVPSRKRRGATDPSTGPS